MKYDLEIRVRRTLRKFGMLEPGEHVLVAVSGGADSVALLLCLKRMAGALDLKLTAAHLNHLLRGAESDADEEFVRQICIQLNVPLACERAGVLQKSGAEKRNLEETARLVRYEFLGRTAAERGAGKIAVGHTQDDQAETVLLHLLRGSGVEGMSGIHPVVNGRLVRPLIQCTRHQIVSYLQALGVAHREDSSNATLSFRRNRVRQELIPYLQVHFNPAVTETLAREAELFRASNEYLESESARAYGEIRTRTNEHVALPTQAVLKLHPALQARVIRQALRECRENLRSVAAVHIRDVLALCTPGAHGRTIVMPGGTTVSRQFDELTLTPQIPEAAPGFSYELPVPGSCLVPEIGLQVEATIQDRPPEAVAGIKRALLEPRLVPGNLLIRARLPGDRYGGPGHRKVKKMLINARINRTLRERLPMIVCGDAVVWIPGFKPARRFAAQGQPVLVLEAQSVAPGETPSQ